MEYNDAPKKWNMSGFKMAMPLLNTAFEMGQCMDAVTKIEDSDSRNVALAEYYYFSGQSATASDIAEEYLDCDDIAIRFSACWIYAYSNLALDRTSKAKKALQQIKNTVSTIDESAPLYIRALATCISTCISALLHLPLPKILSVLQEYIHILPPGLRLYVLYVQAHHSYLNKQYGACIGVAETALAFEQKTYPIPCMYLHLVAAMGYMGLKHPDSAKEHLMKALELSSSDDLIEPIAEHCGLLGSLPESVLKIECPDDYQRMMAITNSFSLGWRKIHTPEESDSPAVELSTIEFSVAMLAARNWSNKEIASHFNISIDTVKNHIASALNKLNLSERKSLAGIMLKKA